MVKSKNDNHNRKVRAKHQTHSNGEYFEMLEANDTQSTENMVDVKLKHGETHMPKIGDNAVEDWSDAVQPDGVKETVIECGEDGENFVESDDEKRVT